MTTYIITIKIETDKPVIVGATLEELTKDAKSVKVTGYEIYHADNIGAVTVVNLKGGSS